MRLWGPEGRWRVVLELGRIGSKAVVRRFAVVLAATGTFAARSGRCSSHGVRARDRSSSRRVHETTVLSGLTNPTVVRFASDGRVFVAEKSGLIKVFATSTIRRPTTFADLRHERAQLLGSRPPGDGARPELPRDAVRLRPLHLRPHPRRSQRAAALGRPRTVSDAAWSDHRRMRREGRLSRLLANGKRDVGLRAGS